MSCTRAFLWRPALPLTLMWAIIVQMSSLFIVCQRPLLAADVKTWMPKGETLTQFKTFHMLPSRVLTKSGLLEEDPQYAPIINAAVRREMTLKGFTEVKEGEDIQVSAGAFTSATPQIEAMIVAWFGVDTGITLGRYNHAGTVAVNLIDPKTKKSVWAGLSSQSLGRASELESDINKATKALFKKYPKN